MIISISQLQQLISEMKEIYNAAKICPYGHKQYDPHVPRMPFGEYPENSYPQAQYQVKKGRMIGIY